MQIKKRIAAIAVTLMLALTLTLPFLPVFASEGATWLTTENNVAGMVTENANGSVTLTAGNGEALFATHEKDISASGISFTFTADEQTAMAHDFLKLGLRNSAAGSQGLDVRFGANILLLKGGTAQLMTVESGTQTASVGLLDNVEHRITVVMDNGVRSLNIYLDTALILSAVFSAEDYAGYVGVARGYVFSVSKKADTPSMSATLKNIVVADFVLGDEQVTTVPNNSVIFANASDATDYTAANGSEVTGGATKTLGTDGLVTSAESQSTLEFSYKRTSAANAAATDKFIFGTVVNGSEGLRFVVLWNKIQLYKAGGTVLITEKAFSGSIGGVEPNVVRASVKIVFDNDAKSVALDTEFTKTDVKTSANITVSLGDDYAALAGNTRAYGFAAVTVGTFKVTVDNVILSSLDRAVSWETENVVDGNFADATAESNSVMLSGGKYSFIAHNNTNTPRVYTQETDLSHSKISYAFIAKRNNFNNYDYFSLIFRAVQPSGNFNTDNCFVLRIEPSLTRLMKKTGPGNAVELKNTNTSLLNAGIHFAEVYVRDETKTIYVVVDGNKILEHTFDESDWLSAG